MRYEKQVAEKKEKGYFTLDDLSKSTDISNFKLFKKRIHAAAEDEKPDEEVKDLQPKSVPSVYNFFCAAYFKMMRDEDPEAKMT